MFLRFLLIFTFLSFKIYASDCEKPKMPTNEEWNSWLIDVRLEAKEKNISDKTINLYLSNVKPQKKLF